MSFGDGPADSFRSRDLYDNHMPLFHILFAPVYALLGDRATILLWMRFISFR